jgi:hypothetical protein
MLCYFWEWYRGEKSKKRNGVYKVKIPWHFPFVEPLAQIITLLFLCFHLVDDFCTLSIPSFYGTWISKKTAPFTAVMGNCIPIEEVNEAARRFFSVVFFGYNTPLPSQLAIFTTLLVYLPSVSPAARTGDVGQIRRQQNLYIFPWRFLLSVWQVGIYIC